MSQSQEPFKRFFESLKSFRSRNPDSWPIKNRDGNALATWCIKQRYRRKLGVLSSDRVALLDSIGFPWTPYASSWHTNLQLLLAFREKNPARWPEATEKFEGVKIGSWCVAQRQLLKDRRLDSDRKKLLDGISFTWEFQDPDLIGKSFSRLKVLRVAGSTRDGKRLWLCACSCGRTTESTTYRLSAGIQKSCGCLRREKASARIKSVQALSAQRRLQTAQQVQERIDKVHGEGTIVIRPESYSGIFKSARFNHRLFGEWVTRPVSVYRGSSHPAEGRRRTNLALDARRLTEGAISLRLPGHLRIKPDSLHVPGKGKAVFIDSEFGEWSASVSNVLGGHGHPKRGSRMSLASSEKTNLKKYGVKYVAQVAEFALRAARAQNKIVERRNWGTGALVRCQGSWELAVVDYLNAHRIRYEWQPEVFLVPENVLTTVAGNQTTYRPDLFLSDEAKWIEIKGFFREDAMKKWAWFSQKYPNSELWDYAKLLSLGILRTASRQETRKVS